MPDDAIPVTIINSTDSSKWPLNSDVLTEFDQDPISTFIDHVSVEKLSDEPLIRMKLTHLEHSGQSTIGVSWAHILGDVASCLHFLNTLSRFYQQMEPIKPLPIFERRLWREDEADQSFLPMMKQFVDAQPSEGALNCLVAAQMASDQLNLHFLVNNLRNYEQ